MQLTNTYPFWKLTANFGVISLDAVSFGNYPGCCMSKVSVTSTSDDNSFVHFCTKSVSWNGNFNRRSYRSVLVYGHCWRTLTQEWSSKIKSAIYHRYTKY